MADVIKDLPQSQYVMIDNFLIDVSIREDHEFDAEVTDYPTESGATFADNIRKRPIRVTMEGLVSNSPIGPIALYRRPEGEQLAFGALGTPAALGKASVEEAYVALLVVWNRREPVTIKTSLGTFERMAMTSLSIPREAQTGAALHFTAQFQQIEIVTNDRLLRKRTAARGGGGKNKRGSQSPVLKGGEAILWRKGRDRYDQMYVGGGAWFGDREKLAITRGPDGRAYICHDNSLLAGFNKAMNIVEYEIADDTVKDGSGNNFSTEIAQKAYRPLSPEELDRFYKDRARDLRREKAGDDLMDSRTHARLFGTDDDQAARKAAYADLSRGKMYYTENGRQKVNTMKDGFR